MSRLDIGFDLKYQVLEPSEFIFKLHAATTARQSVSRMRLEKDPFVRYVVERCRSFGNQHLRLHAEPAQFKLSYSARVDINPFLVAPDELKETPVQELPVDVLHFLFPRRYCPSDRFFQIALQAFVDMPKGYARVAAAGSASACTLILGMARMTRPNKVANATSLASRPVAIRIRPVVGNMAVGSNMYQRRRRRREQSLDEELV